MKGLLMLFALCSLTAAMVPLDRRSVNTEKEATEPPRICKADTPCAWSFYETANKIVYLNLTNTYCICEASMTCVDSGEEIATNTKVHKCKSSESSNDAIASDSNPGR